MNLKMKQKTQRFILFIMGFLIIVMRPIIFTLFLVLFLIILIDLALNLHYIF